MLAVPAFLLLSLASLQPPAPSSIQTPAPAPPELPVTAMAITPDRRPLPTRNVKVDVTITDQAGSGTPMKKVVSLIVADGRSGGVRSNSSVPLMNGGPNRDLPLNVDVTAHVTADQRVLLELRFNYSSVNAITPVGGGERPAPTTDEERARDRDLKLPRPAFANITENLVVLLTPGTPTVVARSADAAADRTVTVEVKADIVK
jgi:hypothetical protein